MYLAFEASTGYGGAKTYMKRLPALLTLLLVTLTTQAGSLLTAPPYRLTFEFRAPQPRRYHAIIGWPQNRATSLDSRWIRVTPEGDPGVVEELGRRLLITPGPGQSAHALVADQPVRLGLEVLKGTWIAEASDAWFAAEVCEILSRTPGVVACHPVTRSTRPSTARYASAPNDPYFQGQWHLENRISSGVRAGADLNLRAAWPITRGGGVLAAIVDDGVELTHPDLVARFQDGPHFNFSDQTSNGGPSTPSAAHSTAVAGILGATRGNSRGVSGVAPEVKLTSWVIFQGSLFGADPFEMKQMFEGHSNEVHVQNHSWGTGGIEFYPLPPLEDAGIKNAVIDGRNGKGVVIVRAASNWRNSLGDANADGYAADPRVIVVAAARNDGRVTRYSNPGTCVLVAGLGGETDSATRQPDLNFPSITTTDRTGTSGVNQIFTETDGGDYRSNTTGFSGTSAATPMISGIVSLILSANPALSYRDVQQALLLSSRHLDLKDPAILTNSAGLRVGRNLGYGIPDAGTAVRLAQAWTPRPPLETVTWTFPSGHLIPDDGLRVEISGKDIPSALISVPVSSGTGLHPESQTQALPIAYAGTANSPLVASLSGQAALILRGGKNFPEKIQNVANAGAAFAIVYNNSGFTDRMVMLDTEFLPIPGVFLSKQNGDLLAQVVQTNPTARVRIVQQRAVSSVLVTNTLVCEHVGVFLRTDHKRRGDLRFTLVSPSGTRSVLQSVNQETRAYPAAGWTYQSVHCFYESSAGLWQLEAIDEEPLNTGSLLEAQLILRGVSILDSDHDGLDDTWELAWFGSLAATANADPDNDGVPNAIEQVLHTSPLLPNLPFVVEVDRWSTSVVRLSWPGVSGGVYQLHTATSPLGPFEPLTILGGGYPITEWMLEPGNGPLQVFRVEQLSP